MDGSLKVLGKYMDVTDGGTTDGIEVQLSTCSGATSQQWRPGGSGSLANVKSGRCLDATGPSSDDGTRLQIWDCSGSANQRWTLPS
ncbi:RICIN domain-containing protein [Streptomyces sp. NPDC007856]|uniref:RICIN domain-containing protein n=1 Tax=Streptomyces sp. NPDC007856 TaxID=3364781 RepID=UPI0036872034